MQDEKRGIFIDHNELLNKITSMTGDDVNIYDDIVRLELSMVRKLLSESHDVIVGRGFATEAGVADYLAIAEEAGAGHIVLRLHASQQLLAERVVSSDRKNDYTPIANPVQLEQWVASHPMEDVANEVVISVDRPFEETLAEVLQTI